LVKKKDVRIGRKVRKVNKAKRRASALTSTRGTIGLPTDPWWEEAFKLGVERVAATAALNSLADAKKEGIVGPKTYDRLRQVYLEKLSAIEDKTVKWHREFPTFSEPAARSKMMSELSEAVGQPTIPERTPAYGGTDEPDLGTRRLTTSRSVPSSSPSTGKKEFGLPSEPSNVRRAMLDELKGVLSSANPSLAKVPATPIGRRPPLTTRQKVQPVAPKLPEVPPPKVQNITVQAKNPARVTSTLTELNREFLEEFRKLKKSG
jgi:hypothetical protein